jgi:ABC-type amino acid transport substrate-binding protein
VRIGITNEDLAVIEGVSANRASNLKASLKKTLREAIEDGDLDDVYDNYFGGGFI